MKARSTAAIAGPRKQHPPYPDERDFCLPLWRQAQREGICKLHFNDGTGPCDGRRVTQLSRLICGLEDDGYVFLHIPPKERTEVCPKCDNRFYHYALVSEPMGAKTQEQTATNYRSQYRNEATTTSTGYKPAEAPVQSQLPLLKTLSDVRAFVSYKDPGDGDK